MKVNLVAKHCLFFRTGEEEEEEGKYIYIYIYIILYLKSCNFFFKVFVLTSK
uniref:Uncharacterized protein n=1 Tax=Physcomitrium patens TaxID=3218 RepID=A0A2K1KW91_PHYPA|nr:hypothetical protein PHYPA_005047 [Physcomitrium patens]